MSFLIRINANANGIQIAIIDNSPNSRSLQDDNNNGNANSEKVRELQKVQDKISALKLKIARVRNLLDMEQKHLNIAKGKLVEQHESFKVVEKLCNELKIEDSIEEQDAQGGNNSNK
ncbi:hypothetical protein KR093_009458 [Drosophila rubida]|uniref:Uncharacterized protein n=1 Tax=Drosophila rubida TaxID=30044 RepID=A0AAD4K762_9MUSC|nr:hypothetical protein KR093_009458 [Drosophila rubida]